MMKFLQKLGKAIMIPVACLPLCGILMGLGYLLCPVSMQGGAVTGIGAIFGLYLVKAGGALIDNIAILFAVGIGVGMADNEDRIAGIAALISWLMIVNLLNADFVRTIASAFVSDTPALLAFQKIENPFIGIIAGLVGAGCYNRFKDTRLPEWLAFFSGKRSTLIAAGLASVLVSAVLMFVWPLLFGGLTRLGQAIAGMGAVGAGLYAFLNRLLLPMGLHHALNNVFWFDTIGLGDITHFWAGHTDADVSWSLGIYMSGFFPCMMFGVPGAVLAMLHCAKKEQKKYAAGVLVSAAVCSFVCGITEPFEFAFMFCSPLLYGVYALLYGIFTYIAAVTGFRAGFAFSGGVTDLVFSASLPAARNTWLILPLGAAAFVVFYLVFRLMITKLDLKTPGREDEAPEQETAENEAASPETAQTSPKTTQAAPETTQDAEDAPVRSTVTQEEKKAGETEQKKIVEGVDILGVIRGLGGKDNILSLENCITRLRVEVKDSGAVDDKVIKKAGGKAVIRPGKNSVQVVIGLKVQSVADAARAQLGR